MPQGSYVQLALEIRSADTTNGPHPTALATIENKGELSKIIDYAGACDLTGTKGH